MRFHDLRHTAIAQGAHPKAIQARMGHSSVQVTLDRAVIRVTGGQRGDRR